MEKKLFRSKKDRKIAGVCSGLAQYMNADPTLIRVLYALLTIFTGFWFGIIAYVVAWIIMPEK